MAALGKRKQVDPDAPRAFAYTAVSSTGQRVKARMTALSADAVARALTEDGWTPVSIAEAPDFDLNVNIEDVFGNRPLKLKPAALAQFSRQLHTLLRVGVSTQKTLLALAEDAPPKLAQACREAAEKVSAGVPLSQALAEYPKAFDSVFTSYLSAGEESGTLVETTERLSVMLEKRADMQKKIKGVTAYPKIVAGVIAMLVFGIITFLVPRYTAIYAGFGAKLPAPTQMLVVVSDHMMPAHLRHLFGLPIPLPVPNLTSPLLDGLAVFLAVRWYLAFTAEDLEIGRKVDRLLFRMPIFGPLVRRTAMFRWAGTLAGGVSSGVQMYRAIDLAAAASGSRWHRLVATQLQEAVRTGRPMSAALADNADLYPVNVRTMVSTGENAGELAEMLENVAEALDGEIDSIIAGLSAKIEVALLVILGVVVGGIIAVLYLPIINLASTVLQGMH